MRYMLDTNICIYTMKRHPPEVHRRLSRVSVDEVAISSIVLAELWHGVRKSQRREHNAAALTDFLAFCQVRDWPRGAAPIYGDIRSTLERQGQVIGANDLLIAAHAIHAGATLATNNGRELERVPGLVVENWASRG